MKLKIYCLQANLAVQQGKHEKANKNLQQAEALLKEKDEELKIVKKEFDAVMAERQVNFFITRDFILNFSRFLIIYIKILKIFLF